MLNTIINKLISNKYVKQIVTLMTGTLVAQAITITIIPIITRIYSPEEFGEYSLFYSIVSVFGLISSLKYDQAIMLPRLEKDAKSIVLLTGLINICVVILTIISLLIFHDRLYGYFKNQPFLIWLIPLGILIFGALQAIKSFSSRNQLYSTLSKVRVLNASSLVSIQSTGRALFNFNFLVFGRLISDFVSIIILYYNNYKKGFLSASGVSVNRMLVNMKRYVYFPRYQSLTVFINSISQNAPIFLFTSFFSVEIAGLYALTVRVLQVPVSLVGASTKEVYYQKASKMYANGENIFRLYKDTTFTLAKLFIIPFFIVLFFGDTLFELVFGSDWLLSGNFSQILIIWVFFSFINPPSVISFSILSLQKIQLKLEILSVIFRILGIFIGYYYYNSFWVSIVLYSITSVCVNLVLIGIIYSKLNKTVIGHED
jgi:O-antigen/teichoic acid export membrane protein